MSLKIRILLSCVLAFAGMSIAAEAQQRSANETAESRRASITLRCTYWSRPTTPDGKETQLFIKTSPREYKTFYISEMAFSSAYEYSGPVPIPIFRKATEEEILKRAEEGIKKPDREYIQISSIDTKGLRDVGVLLTGALGGNSIAFDLSEKSFPNGALRIVNMTGMPLIGRTMVPEDLKTAETFNLSASTPIFTTKGVSERTIKDIMLAIADPNSARGPRVVFASSAAFFPGTRAILFVAKSKNPPAPGKPPRTEVRQITVYPLPPKPKEDETEGNSAQNGNKRRVNTGNGKAEKSAKPDKPKPRRV